MWISPALIPLLLLSAAPATASSVASGSSTSALRTPKPRSFATHTYYALELPVSADGKAAELAAQALGVEVVEPLGELAGHWLVRRETGALSERSVGDVDPVVARYQQLRRSPTGLAARSLHFPTLRGLELLEPKRRTKRLYPPPSPRRSRRGPAFNGNEVVEEPRDDSELRFIQDTVGLHDPLLPKQWHFANQVNREWELNVTKLWSEGVTGKGVNVVVVDDGLDMDHKDLKANYFADGSWDFNDHDPSPAPRLADDQHGTRCAGEIAAVANDVCGVGVAYNARVAGVRILSGPITNADEAAALNYKYHENHIFSCSWGPPDDGRSMEAPDGLILKSMVNGVQKGRNGKGSLFVFAAGNGGGYGDQCNFDGYTNSIFSLTIGAIDHTGRHPFYSERCSAMMLVAPSSGSGDYIHTTDIGGKCASNHGGTSAAAPLMAGVLALALQVRPELTWRDVQHIAVNTAVMLHPDDKGWESTAAGRNYSYKYGYGRIDAGKYVEAARTWKLVKPQAWFAAPAQTLPYTGAPDRPSTNRTEDAKRDETADDSAEEDNTRPQIGSFITEEGVTSSFEVTPRMLKDANFARLEHVTVRVWIDHQRRGDIRVSLRSPNGIVSVLAEPRPSDEAESGFNGWKFMTLKHWEENPVGTWELTVSDASHPGRTGRFKSWSLQLWGEVEDENNVRIWHPAVEGEPDQEIVGSHPQQTQTMEIPQKPKPTALLPSVHGGELPESLKTSPTATPSSKVDTHPAADEGVFDGIDTLRKHSSWLAGAFLIVIIFALGGGAFFLIRQRRRARLFGNSGDDASRGAYAPVAEDEVPMSIVERGRRAVGLGSGKREVTEETRELYDAFGDGPSDSEDEEETELKYHDEFLADDDEHRASGSGQRASKDLAGASSKVESDADDEQGQEPSSPDLVRVGDSTSSGSWQDAGEDVRRD